MGGIAPYEEAVKVATEATIQGIGKFFDKLIMPAVEEIGLYLKDRIGHWRWRMNNLKQITEKADQKLGSTSKYAHPRLIGLIIENGSWSDDEVVQDMWAGLISSSCTPDGQDDSNLLFINLLSQLTKSQAKFLKFSCENASKFIDRSGLIFIRDFIVSTDQILTIYAHKDLHVIDRELDHLRALGLIQGGIISDRQEANIAPTSLGLYMYVRCQGSLDSPVSYFGLKFV